MKPVTTRIPETDATWLADMEAELGADRSEVLRRLIHDGLVEWRTEQALEAVASNQQSIRSAAAYADLTYVEMLQFLATNEVARGYGLEELESDRERPDGRS